MVNAEGAQPLEELIDFIEFFHIFCFKFITLCIAFESRAYYNCFITVEETDELPFRKKLPSYQTFEKKNLPNHDCGPVKKLNYKKTMFPYRYSQEP